MGISSKISSAALRQWPWVSGYNGRIFSGDLVAAIIVTVLLVPQALAYAMLAGLPPQVGIYASIFPILGYALLGSSRFISVGPTAVISLMTAVAISEVPEEQRLLAAAILALLVGVMLIVLGLLKGGMIMNFVSRSVVIAYITGAALLIVLSQIKHILGIPITGNTGGDMIQSLLQHYDTPNVTALMIGLLSIAILLFVRGYFSLFLVKSGVSAKKVKLFKRILPLILVVLFTVISSYFALSETRSLNIVGEIPASIPLLTFPSAPMDVFRSLLAPATIIALVAFVDSMSTAQTLAARARERINSNKELLGLGGANVIAGLTGGYPINGSMSRSAVNYAAGARTPVSGIIVAILMLVSALFLTPFMKHLPLAVLAALIIVACVSLFQFGDLWRVWKYDREDGFTAIATFLSVIIFGVQWGVIIGVVLSMGFHIRSTLKPNMAVVGRFPGTEHYRNADKFNVETYEEVKTLRIDESLYYANARYLEDKIARLVALHPKMTDLILMCTAVNRIDGSALSSLTTINQRLDSAGIKLHISELHSHVKERLHRSKFIDQLTGDIFLSQQEAMAALEPEPNWSHYSDHIDIH